MKIDPKQFAKALIDHTQAKTEEQVKETVKDFVKFLSDNNLLGNWHEIEASINAAWKEKYGAATISITSAHSLTEETKKALEQLAHGAEIKERVDDRLIGGAVIRIDDKRIDGSVTGKLRRLKIALSN